MTNICVNLKNCNNIDTCDITIKKDTLNIKYGINGTGKSTIANAIICSVNDQKESSNSLQDLKPFKCLGEEGKNPEVIGAEDVKSVKIFNEQYVEEFVFKPDELLQGSFDILIRTEEYEKGIQEIEELIKEIKNSFVKDPDIKELLLDFQEMTDCFGKETEKGIHKSSKFMKALGKGNKVDHIPSELECYKDYISLDENFKWIRWQQQGAEYLDLTDNCPYCVSEIKEKKDKIKKVSEVYDPKAIEHLNLIIEICHRLDKYFSEDTKKVLNKLVKKADQYSDEEIEYFRTVRKQIDQLSYQFYRALNLSFTSLKDVDKVLEELEEQKINLEFYPHLNSDETNSKVTLVNTAIENTLKKVSKLQGKINIQKNIIEKLINEHKTEINTFLKNAGYEYQILLEEDDEKNYKLKLRHNSLDEEVHDVKDHLSYGERNAFSLVLFMYDVLKNSPDLIILDDPISSFDKNKKYAIIDMLFKREKCLKGKTVLLLTHDFEPIIDIKHNHTDIFGNAYATFLENSNGELTEKEIKNSDILSFSEICETNVNDSTIHIVNRIVYLRRLYEIRNAKGNAYQLLSNLMHKRETPQFKDDSGERDMTQEEIDAGIDEIKKMISNFDYNEILAIVKDDKQMKTIYSETESNYEKLHLYRIILEGKPEAIEERTIRKFINEAFHIENDYIFQLNPRQYQMIPQFVIDECDSAIESI